MALPQTIRTMLPYFRNKKYALCKFQSVFQSGYTRIYTKKKSHPRLEVQKKEKKVAHPVNGNST
jgi:hypothetical protein